jgi:hypothetical protein
MPASAGLSTPQLALPLNTSGLGIFVSQSLVSRKATRAWEVCATVSQTPSAQAVLGGMSELERDPLAMPAGRKSPRFDDGYLVRHLGVHRVMRDCVDA